LTNRIVSSNNINVGVSFKNLEVGTIDTNSASKEKEQDEKPDSDP